MSRNASSADAHFPLEGGLPRTALALRRYCLALAVVPVAAAEEEDEGEGENRRPADTMTSVGAY